MHTKGLSLMKNKHIMFDMKKIIYISFYLFGYISVKIKKFNAFGCLRVTHGNANRFNTAIEPIKSK